MIEKQADDQVFSYGGKPRVAPLREGNPPRHRDSRVRRRNRAKAEVMVIKNDVEPCAGKLTDTSPMGLGIQIPDAYRSLFAHGDTVTVHPAGEMANLVEPWSGVVIHVSPSQDNTVRLGVKVANSPGVSLEPIDLDHVKINAATALQLPAERASRWQIMPFARTEDRVLVASTRVPEGRCLSAIQRLYGVVPEIHIAPQEQLARMIDRTYAGLGQTAERSLRAGGTLDIESARGESSSSLDLDSRQSDENDIVSLCDSTLATAAVLGASDIHIDTFKTGVRIRYRVDGRIREARTLASQQGLAMISRLKVVSGLDISEKRASQDGRMSLDHGSANIDIRVASLPGKQGERLTLRLLARDASSLTLTTLGMSDAQSECFNVAIAKPHGLVLITGPTGSGKSTTLYAAIRHLVGQSAQNVITIEDPVEYQIDGVTQVEVDHKDKVTFPKALRSALRHDPDVIMVGEIRDAETADIAVKAALTGHLVLSTLHTNDAVGSVTRLRDMGVPLYLVSATLRLVVAQRLVRRLCDRCSIAGECPIDLAHGIGRPDLVGRAIYEPLGCPYCDFQGYTGRIALFEMLPCDSLVGKIVSDGGEESALAEHIRQLGMPLLVDDAVDKLMDGRTSSGEVLRNVMYSR